MSNEELLKSNECHNYVDDHLGMNSSITKMYSITYDLNPSSVCSTVTGATVNNEQ